MKIITVLTLFLTSLIVNAQNYNPFLFGKTYRYINPKDSLIYVQKIDSISLNENNDTVYYSIQKCQCLYYKSPSILTSIKIHKYKDSLVLSGFQLKTNPKINDSWTTNNKNILYLGKKQITFHDIKDSAKIYISTDKYTTVKDTIYLSKNYGIVKCDGLNLYSIQELSIGHRNPDPKSFKNNKGDTIVTNNSTTMYCQDKEPRLYEIQPFDTLSNRMDNLRFDEGYFEQIINGKFKQIIYWNVCLEWLGEIYYMEDIGYYGEEELYCGKILAYFKGLQGEFGDRKKLEAILSIENEALPNNVIISPNPSSGKITLKFESLASKQIMIYDMLGKIIKSEFINEQEYSIDLPKGIYSVKSIVNDRTSVNKVYIF